MANSQAINQLLADAATDPGLGARLVKEPRAALAAIDIHLPAGVAINVLRNDATTFNAVLPLESTDARDAVRGVNATAAKVFERAWGDPAFKARLLSSPRDAFVEATGVMPPPSLRLVAHEDTPTAMHLVIPHFPFPGELSDADLEHVAGGKSGRTSSTTDDPSIDNNHGTGYNQSLYAVYGVPNGQSK